MSATLAREEAVCLRERTRRKEEEKMLQRLLKVKQEGGAFHVRCRSVHLYVGYHDEPFVNVV